MTAPTAPQLEHLIDPILRSYIQASITAAIAPLTAQLETLITERATYKARLGEIAQDAAAQIEGVKKAARPLDPKDIQDLIDARLATAISPITKQLEDLISRPAPAQIQLQEPDLKYTLTKAKLLRLMKEMGID